MVPVPPEKVSEGTGTGKAAAAGEAGEVKEEAPGPASVLPVSPSQEAVGQPAKLPPDEPIGQGGLGPAVLLEKRIPAPPIPKNPVYHEGLLTAGLLIVMIDGGKRTVFRVVYVNNSRAWCVPPGSPQHEGVSIGSNSYVEVVNPREAEEKAVQWAAEKRALQPDRVTAEETGTMATAAIPVATKTNKQKNVEAKARASKTAGIPLRGAAAKSSAARKANGAPTPKTVRACGCGCGEETMGYFAPGHDARWHGWMKKLADGRMEANDPAIKKVVAKLVLKKTGKGYVPTVDYKGEKYVAKH